MQPPPPDLQGWTPVWLSVIGLLTSLLAEWRFRIGWGKPVQWWFDHSERVQGLTSLGYAMRPCIVMMLLNLSAFSLFHAFLWTRADAFAVASFASWALTLVTFLWGLKEYVRPSQWRRTPEWIVALNQRVTTERGTHEVR